MLRQTQREKVLRRIEAVGYVDNFWAFHNYILRLGAIIFSLRQDGYKIEGKFGKGKFRKNYYYRIINK